MTSQACLILRHFLTLMSWMVFLFSPLASGQEYGQSPQGDKNNISSTDHVAKVLINSLPDSNTKNGLLRYYQVLNPTAYTSDMDVAMNNTGLASFFEQQFKNNSCFAEKSLRFYREIKKSTRNTQKIPSNSTRHSRPSLGDKAGVNRLDLQPGWLYQKALQFTGGNPNKALMLIGMCGHDDTNQGVFQTPQTNENLCPSWTSDFFISGSLGHEVDIHEDLKRKILTTQYPGRSPLQVASKNYHVLGAAFMTCQMIEAGLSPFVAIRVESIAANLYRGIRLCQQIETPAALFSKLKKDKKIIRASLQSSFEDAVVSTALLLGRSKACFTKKFHNDPSCELLRTLGAPIDLSIPRIENRAKGLIEKYMNTMIASGLYASWHVSGDIAGITLPCSRAQLFGPHPFLKTLVARGDVNINLCGSGITLESCKKALKTITTWEVDFDWTVSQHIAGAKFAAKVCKTLPTGTSSAKNFCN